MLGYFFKEKRLPMFNSVNNPFGQRIESALSTGQEKRQQQQEQQNDEKKYLENNRCKRIRKYCKYLKS